MKHKKVTLLFIIIVLLIVQFSVISVPVNAKPTKPELKDSPMHGQILPFYEVWLRWYDVPDEAHYTMTIRDLGYNGGYGNNGPLIYNRQYVAQNSTYFIVPTSKLTRGHHYRWCLNSVDASGNRTIADAVIFAIEEYNPDKHFVKDATNTYFIEPRTHTMEYFVYAESNGYDQILHQAAQNWNGHANVTLVRTATPTDGKYEIGIFESPAPADPTVLSETEINYASYADEEEEIDFGNTVVGYNASYRVVYSEVRTYRTNINEYHDSSFDVSNITDYYSANAMHEIGHALLLVHTWNDPDYADSYDISMTLSKYGPSVSVPLIMNSGKRLAGSLNVVDRDHLRIKWGA